MFAEDAAELVAAGDAILVDVRLPAERNDGPLATGTAAWVPFDRDRAAEFIARIDGLTDRDRARQVVLICEVGVRSEWARRVLVQAGYSRTGSVDQGYRSWNAAGLGLAGTDRGR